MKGCGLHRWKETGSLSVKSVCLNHTSLTQASIVKQRISNFELSIGTGQKIQNKHQNTPNAAEYLLVHL